MGFALREGRFLSDRSDGCSRGGYHLTGVALTAVLLAIAGSVHAAAAAAHVFEGKEEPTVWYVDRDHTSGTQDGSSWGTAFPTIQQGVDAAFADGGGEVWVAEGAYTATAVQGNVELYGGFGGVETSRSQRDWNAHVTTISGSGGGHCVSAKDTSVLDGFRVTGGGAGVETTGGTPTIRNCRICDNTVAGAPGYSPPPESGDGGNGGDAFGWGLVIRGGMPVIDSSVFLSNGAWGGAGGDVNNGGCSYFNGGNGGAGNGGGAFIYQYCSATFFNCVFSGNFAIPGRGGYAPCSMYCGCGGHDGWAGPVLYAGAISFHGSSLSVTNCTFGGNPNGAIQAKAGTVTVTNSIMWSGGVVVNSPATITVTYSDVQGGHAGTGNLNANPLFVNAGGGDFHLQPTSPCIDAGAFVSGLTTDFEGDARGYNGYPGPRGDGSDFDIGADEYTGGFVDGICYVDRDSPGPVRNGRSWATAFQRIQDGINSAPAGEEVWVKAVAAYPETISMKTGVGVYGGFAGTETEREQRDFEANVTTIDATTASPRYHVVTMIAVTNTRLDGFTLTGGYGFSGGPADMRGSGITCSTVDATNTIANCIVRGNSNQGRAGGMYFESNSSPLVVDCIIASNTSDYGGAVYCLSSAPTFLRCVISGNTATYRGGAFGVDRCAPTFTNCVVGGNVAGQYGGGFVCGGTGASPVITNCTVCDNVSNSLAGGGITVFSGSNPVITNSIFSKSGGGAIYEAATDADPVVKNCLFRYNWDCDYYDENATALSGAAAINALPGNSGNVDGVPYFVQEGAAATTGTWTSAPTYDAGTQRTTMTDANAAFAPGALVNRLVYGDVNAGRQTLILNNTVTQIVVLGDVTSYVQNGDAYKLADYRLTEGSAALDTGTAAGAPADDILGVARPQGNGVDMGAYELISLAEAVDNGTLAWATEGTLPWFGQTSVSHDGVDAAQSGILTHNQYSLLTTQVKGSGTLSFWWEVSSEVNHDFLRFSIDGVLQDRISGEVSFTQKQYILGPGTHTLKWKYSKDTAGTAGMDAAWVDQVVWTPLVISLADALDNTALDWTTTGNAVWLGQSVITRDHADAAQSGTLADDQFSLVSTQVTGPGTLSFWWKVSSQPGHDFLRFSIDGVLQGRISGDVYFNQKQYVLASGTHMLKWKYSKDASGTAGRDAAWVDEVIWTPDGETLAEGDLRISSALAGGWTRQGDCQTLTAETAGGRFPLEYQWRKDGQDLLGATDDTLTIASATESDSGTYTVEVRDAAGNTCRTSTKLTVTDSVPGPAGIALAVLIGLCGVVRVRRTST